MGSGKSTVGKQFAQTYGYEYYDTDALIEAKENKSIRDIFSECGESYFRSLETDVVRSMVKEAAPMVVSTGGGLPCKEANVELLRNLGCVIFFKASPKILLERLQEDTTRPLLLGDQREKKIQDMLTVRTPMYEHAADIIIDTDQLTVTDIVKRIYDCIQ